MCNTNQALSILEEAYHACNPILLGKIQEAYLYGSYARGDYHEESDVDILLTVNIDAKTLAQLQRSVSLISSDLSLKHDVTVSIAVKPAEQFYRLQNVLPYYQNVVQEGVRYAV